MKKLYVLNNSGDKLFEGSRQQCKEFLKTCNVKTKIVGRYFEKVIAPIEEKIKEAPMLDETTKEGFFNRVFK